MDTVAVQVFKQHFVVTCIMVLNMVLCYTILHPCIFSAQVRSIIGPILLLIVTTNTFLHDVETAGDRLVRQPNLYKITISITVNFMFIYQHCSMGAAWHVIFGTGWTTLVLNSFGMHSTLL